MFANTTRRFKNLRSSFLSPVSRRLFSVHSKSIGLIAPSVRSKSLGIIAGGIAGYSLVDWLNSLSSSCPRLIQLETPEEALTPCARGQDSEDIEVDPKAKPFPTRIKVNGFDYILLGCGIRTVSLFSFQVYACGIYIREEDVAKLPAALHNNTDKDLLLRELMDPEIGDKLIAEVLNSDIGLSIRIVPVRNTDFGHLRDGFVRTLMAHPRFKFESEKGTVGDGITELKRIFSRKMSVPKGNILYLHRRRNGHLIVEYIEAPFEGQGQSHVLGSVHKPVTSELLFLQYLAGKKPSSEDARRSSIQSIASFGAGETVE